MPTDQPNILLAIADDQSWRHAGAYGCRFVHTPGFDRIAASGVLFNHAYCPAPQCAPSRASLLTGRNIWQNQEAGTHGSLFPAHLQVYPDLLESAGYQVGYTGKAWSPGNWKDCGWKRNPAGNEFNRHVLIPPTTGISNKDYARNFEDFMRELPADAPFCFWYGGHEPHRPYEEGSGQRAGKRLEDVDVPPFWPDDPAVRGDSRRPAGSGSHERSQPAAHADRRPNRPGGPIALVCGHRP
ncbi:MAG: sulfatase-like hydrolase/transferase [Lentisphaerae bacterium]|nr:sulfatase-like hydrolase/transferase [Lentisphaerota bacterium]